MIRCSAFRAGDEPNKIWPKSSLGGNGKVGSFTPTPRALSTVYRVVPNRKLLQRVGFALAVDVAVLIDERPAAGIMKTAIGLMLSMPVHGEEPVLIIRECFDFGGSADLVQLDLLKGSYRSCMSVQGLMTSITGRSVVQSGKKHRCKLAGRKGNSAGCWLLNFALRHCPRNMLRSRNK
jgi:hypothetical protein